MTVVKSIGSAPTGLIHTAVQTLWPMLNMGLTCDLMFLAIKVWY